MAIFAHILFLFNKEGFSMTFLTKIKKYINNSYKKIISRNVRKSEINSVYFKNSTTKHSMNEACTMHFSGETEKIRKEIEENLKEIVKQYFNTPEKLIQYIILQGANVYKFNKADKILDFFGEEEGFITPLKGIKALILNFIINFSVKRQPKFSFKTKEMFIFNTNNTEIYTIARALYKYYGYKNNLPGYDFKSQEAFKKAYSNRKRPALTFNTCTIEDMYACKEAIARDLETINFTISLSVEYENSKKAATKIKSNGGTNI